MKMKKTKDVTDQPVYLDFTILHLTVSGMIIFKKIWLES